ncbi:3-hydroxyisobutyrate dehydrogenase [Streptoalloteichus tenebrarius]|uniref:3-hydroxyisobutyrate dehydrogenase n=1 Tax=Streptoalloteichus tenebrarius (strain ATCC 17920 / DSM 40477 / JCM 4838 / CBS 697.72 / NBRC 16177 / NCIMB 11028 / NRRL B-12390 / A12253. 1 / ISP 5477) TaxID=1933 RepID=A0ABT1I320_STRSD|nr:3-hydroxyisobutyrate dehydrogenase [Streptoalloteichus tenebrarius]MCP2262184.1 3-hydroxyisobutyrate dehydrogenase [Streptoalloteichus tenebrarius]BFE98977.1 3-hydroxyisobutyrate dehydrogenase [Streptoalloteichus tenebrarius]
MIVAFLGLGNMGGPMAANLVAKGFQVHGYDPAPGAGHDRVRRMSSAAEAVREADAVVTMLPSGTHVLDCYREILPALRPGTLLVDSSTIDVEDARAAAGLVEAEGHLAVDAPVSGGVVGATEGTLTFMAGGSARALDLAEPILLAMGARVVRCGGAGAGQAAKICNNMVLGVSMIAVSEAFALGRALGLTDQALFDVAATSSAQCWALTVNCPVPGPVPTSPANRGYTGGFASGLMLKDLGLAEAAARAAGVDTAFGRAAREAYARFVEVDGPGRDFSAIITTLRKDDA